MATKKKAPAGDTTAKKPTAKRSAAKKAVAPASGKTGSSKTGSASTGSTSTGSTAAKKSAAKKKSTAKKVATKKQAANKTAANKTAAKKGAGNKGAGNKATPAFSDDYPFTQEFLDSQREALLDERGRYTQHAEFLQAEADQLAREREPGDVQFDEESGEGDSIAVERDRDLQLSAQARAAIEEIDAALGRLDGGTYGICAVSGLPIPHERLEAIPFADMRVEYKSRGATWR